MAKAMRGESLRRFPLQALPEALALFFEGGEGLTAEFTVDNFVLAYGVKDAVVSVHKLVVEVGGEGASGVSGVGDNLSFANGLSWAGGGGQLVEVEEDAASFAAGFEYFEGVAVAAEIPIFTDNHAVEGGLNGCPHRHLKVHALVAAPVIEVGRNLLPLFQGTINEEGLQLCTVLEEEAGIALALGVKPEGLVGFSCFSAGEAYGMEEGLRIVACFIDGPQLVCAHKVLGDRNPPHQCTHNNLSERGAELGVGSGDDSGLEGAMEGGMEEADRGGRQGRWWGLGIFG